MSLQRSQAAAKLLSRTRLRSPATSLSIASTSFQTAEAISPRCHRCRCRSYSTRNQVDHAGSQHSGVKLRDRTSKPVTVLALESSADDSCCAIVTSDRRILANEVLKQHHLNVKYGGIHPLVAKSAHEANIPRAIARTLKTSQVDPVDIDAIAYTRGPGMRTCLAVSAISAKALGAAWRKPVIGIHHMQAHALTPLLTEADPPSFPFLVLLVSGGHTQLVLASAIDKFEILLDTVDNKLGDVFDKTARLLSLPTSSEPNGLILERYASLPPLPPYDRAPLKDLPKAVDDRTRLIFSLGGILSAVDRLVGRLRADGGRLIGDTESVRQGEEQVESDGDGGRGRGQDDRLTVDGKADRLLVAGDDSIFSAGIGGDFPAIPKRGTRTKTESDHGATATPSAVAAATGVTTAPTAFDLTPELKPISEATKREVSRIFQEAVVEHVCRKVKDAIIAKGLNIGLDLDRSGPGGVGASKKVGVKGQAQIERPSLTRESWRKDHDLARSEPEGIASARSQAETRIQLGGLVVSGGVASNQYLRKKLREMLDALPTSPGPTTTPTRSFAPNSHAADTDADANADAGRGSVTATAMKRIPLFYPPIELCTDNAAMIAHTAILRLQADPNLMVMTRTDTSGGEGGGGGEEAEFGGGERLDLEIRPKWSLEDLYDDL